MPRALVPLVACLAALPAADLFHPTPAESMRELSTDRPDTTESPYTVPAGHVQIEAEPVSWSRDKASPDTTTTINGSYNIKAGLLDWADLQVVIEPYRQERIRTRDEAAGIDDRVRLSGFGDTDIRLKINLWGNDGGETAFALMPFVTLATHDRDFGTDRAVQGGLIAPLAFSLPAGWSAAVMAEIDIVRNAAADGYVGALLLSATASHAIAAGDGWELGGFAELVSVTSAEDDAGGEAYFDAGATLGIGANAQLDAGTNLGLTEAAEDVRCFVGISVRR